MGGTSCKVPLATDYIKKVEDKGRIGKKRKKQNEEEKEKYCYKQHRYH